MQPDRPSGSPHSEAISRFWILNAVRLLGLALVLAGIASLGERIEIPRWLAGALLAAGVGTFFGLPLVLARRWKARQ